MSYGFALAKPKNYFRGKIVFIGTEPATTLPDDSNDKFSTPFTRWSNQSSGGVEIIITQFLNLMNGDWLRRMPDWVEFFTLCLTGMLLGFGFSRMKLLTASVFGAAIAIAVTLVAVSWSYFTNYWFPWLIIVGGQIPCALAWITVIKLRSAQKIQAQGLEKLPATAGYKLYHPPFGEGAYGKVWLAQDSSGQWCAIKVIYLKNFEDDHAPYEREFNGVNRYKPVSDMHPGLLRVDFVSERSDGYFYYAMELGDSLAPGWQREPEKYKPRDLTRERTRLPNHRIPVQDCIQLAIELTDSLEFLHNHGLTHRDIKPQNVIFVNGHPKLADLGLVAEIRPDKTKTIVGTPGYMPPPPEPPGTPQADIYALGMLLYVISTGNNAALFPEIATSLVRVNEPVNFLPLNGIILKACQPDLSKRYQTMTEMRNDLKALSQ
jgi:hypothetical protein